MSGVTLTEFLLARLAEDEQMARAATQGRWVWADPSKESFPQADRSLVADSGEWKRCDYYCQWSGEESLHRGEPGAPGHEHRVVEYVILAWGYDASGVNVEDADAAHIARYDPARVLAEVAAKRRIVELHSNAGGGMGHDPPGGDYYGDFPSACLTCGTPDEYAVSWPCTTLRLLALPFADHPDYRSEWAP